MASNFIPTLYFLSCLLIFTSSFQTCVKSLPSPAGSSDKVSLEIYYDSLDLKGASVFNEIYKIISIVDLHLSPWGNARVLSNKTIECQNGEKECFLNTIAACAIHVWPDVEILKTHWEKSDYIIYYFLQLVDFCKYALYRATRMDRRPIDECYRSGLGSKLELKYAEETAALKPSLQYTPWVVVGGKPIYKDFSNLSTYVCKSYKGSSPPEACKAKKGEVSYRDHVAEGRKLHH